MPSRVLMRFMPATVSAWPFRPGRGRFLLCKSSGPSSEVLKNAMAIAEIEDVICEHRQIGSDDELEIALVRLIALFGKCHHGCESVKVEEWLTALEFDLDRMRWTLKREIYRLLGYFISHVECDAILGLSRYLAILACVITAQCDNEHVEARELRDATEFGPVLKAEQFRRNTTIVIVQEVPRFEIVVLIATWRELMGYQLLNDVARNDAKVTGYVR